MTLIHEVGSTGEAGGPHGAAPSRADKDSGRLLSDPWVRHVMRVRWQDDASCRAHLLVADAWFPENEEGHALQPAREVVATCAACPVRAECLSFALVLDEPYGVWGGVGCRKTRMALRRRWLAGGCLRQLVAEAVAADVEGVAA